VFSTFELYLLLRHHSIFSTFAPHSYRRGVKSQKQRFLMISETNISSAVGQNFFWQNLTGFGQNQILASPKSFDLLQLWTYIPYNMILQVRQSVVEILKPVKLCQGQILHIFRLSEIRIIKGPSASIW